MKILLILFEYDVILGQYFKDFWEYVFFVMWFVYDGKVIVNVQFLFNVLCQLGELLFGCEMFDGFLMVEVVWVSFGQMMVCFDVVCGLVGCDGNGNGVLFCVDGFVVLVVFFKVCVESVVWL